MEAAADQMHGTRSDSERMHPVHAEQVSVEGGSAARREGSAKKQRKRAEVGHFCG
jgi:hypothetical protein